MAKSFVWDYESAGELLLRSEEIASICDEEAQRMTQATGVDYIPKVHVGAKRVFAKIGRAGRKRICPKCGRWHQNCNCKES